MKRSHSKHFWILEKPSGCHKHFLGDGANECIVLSGQDHATGIALLRLWPRLVNFSLTVWVSLGEETYHQQDSIWVWFELGSLHCAMVVHTVVACVLSLSPKTCSDLRRELSWKRLWQVRRRYERRHRWWKLREQTLHDITERIKQLLRHIRWKPKWTGSSSSCQFHERRV